MLLMWLALVGLRLSLPYLFRIRPRDKEIHPCSCIGVLLHDRYQLLTYLRFSHCLSPTALFYLLLLSFISGLFQRFFFPAFSPKHSSFKFFSTAFSNSEATSANRKDGLPSTTMLSSFSLSQSYKLV